LTIKGLPTSQSTKEKVEKNFAVLANFSLTYLTHARKWGAITCKLGLAAIVKIFSFTGLDDVIDGMTLLHSIVLRLE
jgi:hypothetical protein